MLACSAISFDVDHEPSSRRAGVQRLCYRDERYAPALESFEQFPQILHASRQPIELRNALIGARKKKPAGFNRRASSVDLGSQLERDAAPAIDCDGNCRKNRTRQ
jgi:hypothetical protein